MESFTTLTSPSIILLNEDCLSRLPNLRTLGVTGLTTGAMMAKVFCLNNLKMFSKLQTVVLDKVNVFVSDRFRKFGVEVPKKVKDEERLEEMFRALSELKYLQELRITLSPRIRAPSRLRLRRCCRSYQ